MKIIAILCCCGLLPGWAAAQETQPGPAPLLTNVTHRHTQILDGSWHYLIDPLETGYFDYRHQVSARGFFQDRKAASPEELVEYGFDQAPTLRVPGDWNSQDSRLLYYEGTLWYQKTFVWHPVSGQRVFLHFGAVNYDAVVAMNGQMLGRHTGGFTPFDFEVTKQLKEGANTVVVKVSNVRRRDGVPTVNFDWWNYGGITRSVRLVVTPNTFVQDYFLHLTDPEKGTIEGWVQLNGPQPSTAVTLEIPALRKSVTVTPDSGGRAAIRLSAKYLRLWSPEDPWRYSIRFTAAADTLEDEIGFRTIRVQGTDILLNGKPLFLRGTCLHEEAPYGGGRAVRASQDRVLLSWAKEMGCNFVRLAHYPYNEDMIREAEKMGILVWSEVPVYWTIQWENPETLHNAENQLTEMITRDRNRANIILWSVGNETPRTAERLRFMQALVQKARELDPSRLITAALQLSSQRNHVSMLDDPLGESLDVLGCNVYPGWYGPSPSPDQTFQTPYQKPLIMSEFGGGAVQGRHGSARERWTEEFQDRVIADDIAMLRRIPFLRGTTPWILKDFRSPKRLLPGVQDGWNLKGLISDAGVKKKAFFTMQAFYQGIRDGRIVFGQ